MTADGKKMGKTEKGAVWLDPERTHFNDYYQFWVNTDDRDVIRFLALFTFLPMEKIREYERLKGAELRTAKRVLAFEATKIVHGEEKARKAEAAARALFVSPSDGQVDQTSGEPPVSATGGLPTTVLGKELFSKGVPIFKLFEMTGLCASGSEARRLIEQGGAYLDRERVDKFDLVVTLRDFSSRDEILLRAGKKKFHRIKIA
jgi:tyrosyl-tRNA synthetase